MRTGRQIGLVLGLVVLLALAPGAATAEAPPASATIDAVDFSWQDTTTGKSSTVIAPGGTVVFAYPSGAAAHNAVFTGAAPTSCTQTAGADSGAVPPLPATPTGPGWAGSCTFATEGTYAFVCGLHGFMKGSVVVAATLPSPGEGGGSGGGGGGGAGGGAGTSPAAAASGLVVARIQRGTAVRGSVFVAAGGSRLVVDVLARRSALGGDGAKLVGAARRLSKPVGAGKRTFTINLAGGAKRAIADAGRLPVTVKVKVVPASGAAFQATRAVVVRAAD